LLFALCPLPSALRPEEFLPLRLIHIYLVAYFALVAGAFLALWRAGVLARVPSDLLLIATIIVVALGVLVAVTSTRSGRIFL
jgi:hypothetical protein